MLLFIKKINIKDAVKYYLLPLFIVCIPYIIFPNYFLQMLHNWLYIEGELKAKMTWWLQIYLISWQAFQTAQLLYVFLMITICLQRVQNTKLRWFLRIFLTSAIIIVNVSFPVVLFAVYSSQ